MTNTLNYISTTGVWITCTYWVDCEAEHEIKHIETDDVLTICCVLLLPASHYVVWLEATNKILSVQPYFNLLSMSVVSFVRLVRICSFEGFALSSLFIYLTCHNSSTPVPKFPCRVGSVGRAECEKVDDWYWCAGSSGTMWSSEHDRGGIW